VKHAIDPVAPLAGAERVRFVLVNTSHPGNIGSAARAIKTMGFGRLVLVAPTHFPHEEADWLAAGAQDILTNACVVPTLDDAIADCHYVVGTSARGRRIPWPLQTPRESGDLAWAEVGQGHEVAFVFGREDRGLTNDELQRCHAHVHIPANPEYSALNIAMALQVVAYEVRMSALAALAGGAVSLHEWDMPPATDADMERLYVHWLSVMTEIGFLDPENPKQMPTRLRRLFGRIRPDQMEVNILRGFLTTVASRRSVESAPKSC
jgi:tRNA (cytidine32/uridine32-2'-O)-methyltransferase